MFCLQGIPESCALLMQPTLPEFSAQFWLFCCFLFSRSSRQLGAEIGQQARAVWPQDCCLPGMAFRFRMSEQQWWRMGDEETRAGQLEGCRARVEAFLQVVWFVILAAACVCVSVCVANWLNCGSSFRFCGSHNLCALYALPKSWLGLRRHWSTGAAFGVAACSYAMCVCVCVRVRAWRGQGVETGFVEWELRQIRVAAAAATGSIVSGQNN